MAVISFLKTSAATLRKPIVAEPPLSRLFGVVLSRKFGTSTAAIAAAATAAQQQFDYDHHCYSYQEDDARPLRREIWRSEAAVDTEGSVPLRGVRWAFVGSPNAKKHVYAVKLSELLEVPHISVAGLVRQDLSPRSSLYKQIANAVNRGEIVPEEIIISLLSKRLEDGYYRGEIGFILDGIPRTLSQAEILDQLVDIDLVVNFKCVEEHRGKSILCPSDESDGLRNSASSSSVMSSQDTQPKFPMGNAGNLWKEKVHVHAKQMKQVEDYYIKQKKLINFLAGSTPGETWQGLLAALHLQYINASNSKLTLGSRWL